MKGQDKKVVVTNEDQKNNQSQQNSDEGWVFIGVVIIISLTLIFTTRMHLNANLMGEMIQHYTLRGKEVLVEGNEVVFVN